MTEKIKIHGITYRWCWQVVPDSVNRRAGDERDDSEKKTLTQYFYIWFANIGPTKQNTHLEMIEVWAEWAVQWNLQNFPLNIYGSSIPIDVSALLIARLGSSPSLTVD